MEFEKSDEQLNAKLDWIEKEMLEAYLPPEQVTSNEVLLSSAKQAIRDKDDKPENTRSFVDKISSSLEKMIGSLNLSFYRLKELPDNPVRFRFGENKKQRLKEIRLKNQDVEYDSRFIFPIPKAKIIEPEIEPEIIPNIVEPVIKTVVEKEPEVEIPIKLEKLAAELEEKGVVLQETVASKVQAQKVETAIPEAEDMDDYNWDEDPVVEVNEESAVSTVVESKPEVKSQPERRISNVNKIKSKMKSSTSKKSEPKEKIKEDTKKDKEKFYEDKNKRIEEYINKDQNIGKFDNSL